MVESKRTAFLSISLKLNSDHDAEFDVNYPVLPRADGNVVVSAESSSVVFGSGGMRKAILWTSQSITYARSRWSQVLFNGPNPPPVSKATISTFQVLEEEIKLLEQTPADVRQKLGALLRESPGDFYSRRFGLLADMATRRCRGPEPRRVRRLPPSSRLVVRQAQVPVGTAGSTDDRDEEMANCECSSRSAGLRG